MAKVEFVIPSVLNKGTGERKISLEVGNLDDAFTKLSDHMGEDFKRRVFDLNGRPRPLINIYINGKNTRFSTAGGTSTSPRHSASLSFPERTRTRCGRRSATRAGPVST